MDTAHVRFLSDIVAHCVGLIHILYICINWWVVWVFLCDIVAHCVGLIHIRGAPKKRPPITMHPKQQFL